jgi:hypothetical protein
LGRISGFLRRGIVATATIHIRLSAQLLITIAFALLISFQINRGPDQSVQAALSALSGSNDFKNSKNDVIENLFYATKRHHRDDCDVAYKLRH